MKREELQNKYMALVRRHNELTKTNETLVHQINILEKDIVNLKQEIEEYQTKTKPKVKKIMEEVIVINDVAK